MLSHFSPNTTSLSSSFALSFSALSSSLRCRPRYFSVYPPTFLKSVTYPPGRLSLLCNLSTNGRVSMDSARQGVSVSVDSVTQDLKNQSLQGNHFKEARLKLEDLNWDNSFVRELPADPRTDLFPREVNFWFHGFYIA